MAKSIKAEPKKQSVKTVKATDQIIAELKSAEGEEGRTGLVEAFLKAEKKGK